MSFGERLREARETRGQSRADVAAVLGCHVNSVLRWEMGRAVPHGYHRRQLEAAYPELREVAP